MSMLEHALCYARGGWAVFPLAQGTKVPLTGSNGFKDASTDTDIISRWWAETPAANIGMATGDLSGVWVIDVDIKKGKDGRASLKAYAEQFEEQPRPTRRVRTPSGGLHIYVAYDRARPIRSRANVLTGVDIRADGGYVVLPPSTTPLGAYEWAVDADEVAVAEATGWYAALPHHRAGQHVSAGHGAALKRDRSRLLSWDMVLNARRSRDITLDQTAVGQKYVCRCPFHDDRTSSAFFVRKSEGYGFLYCSACDASWATERRHSDVAKRIAAIELRLQQIQGIRNGQDQ